jgi:hypothetical protein
MTLPYRKSAGADRCRWPSPDADGRCRFCGWALTKVRAYGEGTTFVTGHYRHRKPRELALSTWSDREYPHESGTSLALSEVVDGPSSATPASSRTTRTQQAQGTYPQQLDITSAFVQRAGAGSRLIVPTVDEWAAWKAAVA